MISGTKEYQEKKINRKRLDSSTPGSYMLVLLSYVTK